MKFQDDISNMNTYVRTYIHTYIHTYIRTSRNQYVPYFFKVGGITTFLNINKLNVLYNTNNLCTSNLNGPKFTLNPLYMIRLNPNLQIKQ